MNDLFGEFKDASSFQLAAFTLEVSPSTKKLKRACIESSGTSTLWAPKTLDLLVTIIS